MISNCHTSNSLLRVRKSSFLKIIFLFLLIQGFLFCSFSFAQHPDMKRINELEQELPFLQGNSRTDCLNSLSEEYWWAPRPNPDSIYSYPTRANIESIQSNYLPGLNRSILNLGVSEIYRRNYPAAETYLRQSIMMSGNIHDDNSKGWSYMYLGWVFFLKNEYANADDSYKKATAYFQKKGEDEVRGKLCGYKSILYTAMGDYEKGFEYCRMSLQIRK